MYAGVLQQGAAERARAAVLLPAPSNRWPAASSGSVFGWGQEGCSHCATAPPLGRTSPTDLSQKPPLRRARVERQRCHPATSTRFSLETQSLRQA